MDKITHKVRCEQWTNIIKECLTSGMSKTTWCREDGISDKWEYPKVCVNLQTDVR